MQRTAQLSLILSLLALNASAWHPSPASAQAACPTAGPVSAWGSNIDGQLGDGSTVNRASAVQAVGLGSVLSVAAGSLHSLAVKPDGTVWAWGDNFNGQLGLGDTTSRSAPTQVPGLASALAVAAGYGHSLALMADGTVQAWGWNAYGQLGNGTTTDSPSPAPVPGLTGVVAIAAGGNHSLAVRADGTVWGWGDNSFGQVGIGSGNLSELSPVQVAGLAGITAVAAGRLHSLALDGQGRVWAWGYNGVGQLGTGSAGGSSPTPVAVSSLPAAKAIAAGFYQSLAVARDGSAYAWGWNAYGQLGNGSTTSASLPQVVSGLSGVVGLAGGFYHSAAVLSNGSVWTWGYNLFGQLGTGGSPVESRTPLQAPGISGATAIACGDDHCLEVAGSASSGSGPPVTQASVSPVPNKAGWNNRDVVATLTASDACGAGVQSLTYSAGGAQVIPQTVVPGPAAGVSVTTEGITTLTFFATDLAGVAESPQTLVVRIDKTPPAIIYSGNAGTYTVDQTVSIDCTATDSGSGVESSTCADITGPAYTFALGANTFSATATDLAGNTGTGSVTFAVEVTFASLCALTRQFAATSGVANGLCAKLAAAAAARSRGNADAVAGSLGAYAHQVSAQTGKALTPGQAAILTRLAAALQPVP